VNKKKKKKNPMSMKTKVSGYIEVKQAKKQTNTYTHTNRE